jgi:hypothetical protein
MIAPLDVFKVEKDGTLRWLEVAETLEAAKARIAALGAKSPGEYVIYSQKTGNKTVVKTSKDQRAEG